jgi:hypothetical protein
MRCTCSATSRPIPTGSTPRRAKRTTARRWRSLSRAACALWSLTATSGSPSWYRRTGKPDQAEDYLTTATMMHREMDMQFWLSQAATEARELA